jgi:hypothetical protein
MGFDFDECEEEVCISSSLQQLGTWKPSQHLLEDRANPRKPVFRRPVPELPSGVFILSKQYLKSQSLSIVRIIKSKEGKAIPVTGRGGPWGYETSRLPHFL